MSSAVDPTESFESEDEDSFSTASSGSCISDGEGLNDLPPITPRGSTRAEDSLQAKNAHIANVVKDITMNSLTPNTKRKLTQREELERAEARQQQKQPSWLLRAQQSRTSLVKKIEEKREKTMSVSAEGPRPEWIQKAQEAQISRDLRGLDRFLNQKAPALPAEPEWYSKACKRRDLTTLLHVNERTHESNKETPLWVTSSSAQRILNSFLRNDEGVLPDWMKKGVEMSKDEKNEMLLQLEELKKLLVQEQHLTAERETRLASCKDTLQTAQRKLDESVNAFRNLREHRKDANVQGFVESANEVYARNSNFMNKTKDEFQVHQQVKMLVEKQQAKEEGRRENRQKASKEKKTKVKAKPSSKRSKKKKADAPQASSDSSRDETSAMKANLEVPLAGKDSEDEGSTRSKRKKRGSTVDPKKKKENTEKRKSKSKKDKE